MNTKALKNIEEIRMFTYCVNKHRHMFWNLCYPNFFVNGKSSYFKNKNKKSHRIKNLVYNFVYNVDERECDRIIFFRNKREKI